MEHNMQTLLNKISEIQKKEIVKQTEIYKRGENFNVFNVLGLWSEEVRLHSAMLAELLNPAGSHGCGEAFLKMFFEDVVRIQVSDKVNELNKAITSTEFYIGSINETGDKGGRIDILIEMPQNSEIPTLVMENKIYAGDQPSQLLRYYNYATDKYKKNFILLYLTLYGNDASDLSTGTHISFDYMRISYAREILKWLEHCAAIAYDKPKVRETIIQYKHLLTQITTYYMNEKNPIVEEIISNKENLKSAILICTYQNEIIKKVIAGPITKALKNIKEIAEEQTQLNIEFTPDEVKERQGKLAWNFSYKIKKDRHIVTLKYEFNNYGLSNLYYGIEKGSNPINTKVIAFKNTNENWPWGWEWVSAPYNNWTGENLCKIIDELSDENYQYSNFGKDIIKNIKEATKLLEA